MKYLLVIIIGFYFTNLNASDFPSKKSGKVKEEVSNIIIHGNAYVNLMTNTEVEIWCYTNPDAICVEIYGYVLWVYFFGNSKLISIKKI